MGSGAELVSFVARAENRLAALASLNDAAMTRRALQDETAIPRATLSRILADFRDRDLVVREGHRYVLTPLGATLASELESVIDTVDAMRRLAAVQRWLPIEALDFPVERLGDADVVLPSPQDPTAPIRRAEGLLADAGHVRLIANSVIPACVDAAWRAVSDGRQTLDWVTTPDALSVVAADPALTRQIRDLLRAERTSVTVHDQPFPQAVFIADDVVFTAVKDDAGTVQGHIETDDAVVLAWAEETIDGFAREADPLEPAALTT